MRRLLTLMILALVAAIIVPTAASAQENDLGWEINGITYLDVSDLGFRVYYPVGWVYGADKDGGIGIADTQANLDLQIDGDDATQPTGLSIAIQGIPLEVLGDVGENPRLDTLVDIVMKGSDITETGRVEVPIMTRRSITVVGTRSDGRAGLISMWQQNGNLILMALGGPDTETVNGLAEIWGVTIGNVRPLDAQELGDGQLTDAASSFTINYPDGWTPDPDHPVIVYEVKDDIGKSIQDVTGNVFTFSDVALSDLQLTDDATLDEVVAKAVGAFDIDPNIKGEEFTLMAQPAITISAEPVSESQGVGHGVILTISKGNGRAVLLILVTPSKEAADAFMPTWIEMLSSVKASAAAS